MNNTPKKANHEPANKPEENNKPAKDYAHYPPAAAEQVKPPAHKNHAADKGDDSDNPPATSTVGATNKEAAKALNGSSKIVNEVDESYSDGSGGGFEATEQVNE